MTPARVSIVTVLYNSAEQLPAFLNCLAAQTLPEWQLVTVDNASSDESRRLVAARNDPRITIISNAANLGFAQGANQGLRAAFQAGAQCFVLMNNDTVFAPEFFATLLSAREQFDAAVLVPRIMQLSDPSQVWYAGGHLDYRWVFRNIHDPYDPADLQGCREVDFASGCCLLLTRAVLEQVGLLDERFFVYWEDTDFCMRLKQHGIPITYVPGVSLLHEGGASSGGEFSASYNRLYYRSYMQLLRKHFGMAVTLRSGARLLMKEAGRPQRDFGKLAWVGFSMARGLMARTRRTLSLGPGETGR